MVIVSYAGLSSRERFASSYASPAYTKRNETDQKLCPFSFLHVLLPLLSSRVHEPTGARNISTRGFINFPPFANQGPSVRVILLRGIIQNKRGGGGGEAKKD